MRRSWHGHALVSGGVLVAALGACADVPQVSPPLPVDPISNASDSGGDDSGVPNFSDHDSSFGPDGGGGPPGPQPTFGPTVTQSVPPPPISGGTLIVTRDDTTAVVADPDRDAIYIVDLVHRSVLGTVALEQGAEPGRLVEDAARRVHVVTRHAGDLLTVDLASRTLVRRRAVCSAPRGVAYDAATDSVHVACASGDLVTFPAAGGAATRTLHLPSDLRDVLVIHGEMYVTRFRSAELLLIASDGTVLSRSTPPTSDTAPGVAWRAVALPGNDGVAVVHQLAQVAAVAPSPGGYGGSPGCSSSIVSAGVTAWRFGGAPSFFQVPLAVLPVDMAVSPNGGHVAIAAPGNAFSPLPRVVVMTGPGSAPPPDGGGPDGGGLPPPPPPGPQNDAGVVCAFPQPIAMTGQVTSLAFDSASRLIVFTREPASIQIITNWAGDGAPIALSTVSRADTGHDIFHSNAGALIACASCHAEGGDDGRVWSFVRLGPRRTPSLRGTIAGTAPYHWDGAMFNFPALEHDVFEGRMSGPHLRPDQVTALQAWTEAIPAPPQLAPVDAASAARGQALFTGSAGCASCHSGPKYTNNHTVDVGTGGAFQVPPLVGIAWRAPFLHGGCAATLADRFGSCATSAHGNTQGLSTTDVGDLVAYLSTL